jgi:ATP-binding cassette subfamily F protein 3
MLMLVEIHKLSKSIGAKDLFADLSFTIDQGEKIALIGRNGQGKTTLLKIISGIDQEFTGQVNVLKNSRLTLTQQEHLEDVHQTSLNYILASVPNYFRHQKILDSFEAGNISNLNTYSNSVEYFSHHGYYHIVDKILNTLQYFQISNQLVHQPLSHLSGGQKRYVELTRMMYSQADLFLIDEPTNHMDYLGKEQFITWLQSLRQSVLVVTHDRDVLKHVSKIIELKDQQLSIFKGNYDHYISTNSAQTTASVKEYSDQLNRLKAAKKRVQWGLQMRAKSKEWKVRYDHWLRDYEKLKSETIKPSFWIDQDSVAAMDKKVLGSYHKYKEKNITISTAVGKEKLSELLTIKNLSLGYHQPIFSHCNFTLKNNDRVFIKGINGAGKSTLVRQIIALARHEKPPATLYSGDLILGNKLRIGEYEQEISGKYLHLTLEEAIAVSLKDLHVSIDVEQVKALLSQYLFDPRVDGRILVKNLSGGQKARFQLIKMFAIKPNLLILDEPTNHLDLPSIEELENTLATFQGGILYISHDTYFIDHLGGKVVEI